MGATKNGFEVNLKEGSYNPVMPVYDVSSFSCCFIVSQPPQKSTYKVEFSVCKYPTANCQVSSIGRVDNILSHLKSKEDIFEVLTEAYNLLRVKMLLCIIDCKEIFAETVSKFFKVVNKSPYTSSNGSKMVMFLVDMRE